MDPLNIVALFLVISGLFLYINTYHLKLPVSIGLMVLSLVSSLFIILAGALFPVFFNKYESILDTFDYSRVLYDIIITFMLFAGALEIDFKKLAQEKWTVIVLSVLGVLFSTFIVGTAIYYLIDFLGIHLGYLYCLVFGALVSPVDPLATISLIKKYGLSENLETRIFGESLFNDGISVVLALTLLDIAYITEYKEVGFLEIGGVFLSDVGGGVILGIVLGYIGLYLLRLTSNDHIELEILITIAIVFIGTQLAHKLHVSAKQGIVIAGLIIGNEGRSHYISGAIGEYVFRFWILIDKCLNAIIFVIITLQMLTISVKLSYLSIGLLSFLIVIFARWISVYIPLNIMKLFKPRNYKYEPNTIPIMVWGGMKGGVTIALVLCIPEFQGKDIIVTMTYIVVFTSIFTQGFTIKMLVEHTASITTEKHTDKKSVRSMLSQNKK
ncbi:MAG: sodium:proton antiporter [Chitinophagaceae bacterium]|nr:sodium:proton antiporter [Chitinophagaceae bacterium]